MSDPSRCGSLVMVQVLKSLSHVCRSDMHVERVEIMSVTDVSCSVKNSLAKDCDPTGVPRRRNPLVSLTPISDFVCLHRWCE